ncbi:MAG: hypothetical protein L6Q29_00315 [Candidatus Pacebacteria bacterium]|nr:hypothetical protein [Candidatus Paceibacterota bacterium]NUQ57454.1 hypothetical protein [Candidatus Paceibacter sp.]
MKENFEEKNNQLSKQEQDKGNPKNAVSYQNRFAGLMEEEIMKEKRKIETIIKESEKIKEEADKLFNKDK